MVSCFKLWPEASCSFCNFHIDIPGVYSNSPPPPSRTLRSLSWRGSMLQAKKTFLQSIPFNATFLEVNWYICDCLGTDWLVKRRSDYGLLTMVSETFHFITLIVLFAHLSLHSFSLEHFSSFGRGRLIDYQSPLLSAHLTYLEDLSALALILTYKETRGLMHDRRSYCCLV